MCMSWPRHPYPRRRAPATAIGLTAVAVLPLTGALRVAFLATPGTATGAPDAVQASTLGARAAQTGLRTRSGPLWRSR